MPGAKPRKIAAEEAFSIPEIAEELGKVARAGGRSLDLLLVKAIYDAASSSGSRAPLRAKLLDVDETRIADMDENGVDMQILSLTAPGVQLFDADTACDLAALANDRLAEAIGRHPGRYAGLAAFAPHAPRRAAQEMQRAIGKLGLNGFIVNSHTNDEYLDNPKYWPILEAAEALDRPIYIHPRAASTGFDAPLRDYGMDAACWGYGMEVGTHAVRILLSGVLDRFPKLKIVIGHMGEAVHFWLWRIEFMNNRAQKDGRAPKLALTATEYFKRNFAITTSGVEDPLALDYSVKKLGVDNVLWAIDYPYQPSAPAVAFMNAAPLADADRAKIYGGNAARVFKIASA
jgi:2,3-dihydroxybenzoate decarboxylase/5-carboxyvanillate decarboxylase